MKWGLVLSGGAAYGIANAGVLEVLEKENLQPSYIAGSSMGAIVASLHALGHSSAVLRDLCENVHLTNVASLARKPLKGGLQGGLFQQQLEEILKDLVGDSHIGDCTIPFVCIAGKVKEPIKWQKIVTEGFTDHVLERVEKYVFPEETKIIDAIMASSAIPVLFAPVKIGEDLFIDLCHFGSIASRTLKDEYNPDVIIATDTNPSYIAISKILPPGWKEFIEAGYESAQQSKDICNLLISPEMPAGIMRFDRAEEFMEAGKEAAENAIPEIKNTLEL